MRSCVPFHMSLATLLMDILKRLAAIVVAVTWACDLVSG